MTINPSLLFYDEFSQQPACGLSNLPGMRMAGNLTRLEDALKSCSLIFLQAGGTLRQEGVRLLLKEKKSFMLLGLEPADLNDSARLQTAARKKHLQIGWMGSLRFHRTAAHMKELLSGGCLGEILECQFSESLNSPWEPYQIQDLLHWLLPEKKSFITRIPCSGNDVLSIDIKGTNGRAQIRLQDDQAGTFRTKLHNNPEKIIRCPNQAAVAELGLLLLLHSLNKPWDMIAKPWECSQ